jgi:hypothetical protein
MSTLFCGCDDTTDACADQFAAAEDISTVESPDTYLSGVQKVTDQGHFIVELVRSTPPPKFTGDFTWELTVQDNACVEVGDLEVKAEPTMPQHGHGTTPEYTDATVNTANKYTLTDMNLFMPGVWQIEVTVTASDGTVDTVSWFFDLEG